MVLTRAGAVSGVSVERPVAAVGFDAFTIFDPRAIDAAIEAEFPGHGAALGTAWRNKLFDYCWLRTITGHYANFLQIAQESLTVVMATAKLGLTSSQQSRLMDGWFKLRPWPDSLSALARLKQSGVRLTTVSNFTSPMLETLAKAAGLADLFELQLSTDQVHAFKPSPQAYAMAERALGLPRDAILFAAFGGWDAAGARSFGLKTFWVNRFGLPEEKLGAKPEAVGVSLAELAGYVLD